MLITTCGNCKARFRVTPQQLNARQGQVRCGKCQGVFNGFQALERMPDDDTGGRLLAVQEAREQEAEEQGATAAAATYRATPHAPLREAPKMEDVGERPVSSPPPRPTYIAPPPYLSKALTLDLPPENPPSRAWWFGVALVLLILLAQLAFAFRGPAAQRYPALRPSLEAACTWLRCNVPYAREEGSLKLQESELLEVPGRPAEIALAARIRNLATVAQEYPYLELTLTDNSGQAAARRVLRPTDYLGRPLAPGEVIAPGVEVALQLRLETPRFKATGYELLLFYP